jgi:hypothetical protein
MRHDFHRRERRRTCYDRARKRWLETRRARTKNPAASATMQFLGIFGYLFGRISNAAPMPTPYIAPRMSPSQAKRNEAAQRLGVPTRYLDIVLSQGRVPYALLSAHIRLGGATRKDAMNELRKVIPAEALDWLNHVEKRGLWSDLSRCFRADASDEDIDVLLLKATLAWVGAQKKPDGSPSEPTETKHGLEPPKLGENEGPDDKPKPPTS